MGGKVGLKGTDKVSEKALKMGAKPIAPQRGLEFLKKLKGLGLNYNVQLITCPTIMGKEEVRRAGLDANVLPMKIK